jgi:DNA-binding NtrC family response regulator
VRRAVIVCRGPAIRASDITLEFGRASGGPEEEIIPLEEQERRYIQEALRRTGGVIKGPRGAAALLGLPESTLRSRMKKLGILRTQA